MLPRGELVHEWTMIENDMKLLLLSLKPLLLSTGLATATETTFTDRPTNARRATTIAHTRRQTDGRTHTHTLTQTQVFIRSLARSQTD